MKPRHTVGTWGSRSEEAAALGRWTPSPTPKFFQCFGLWFSGTCAPPFQTFLSEVCMSLCLLGSIQCMGQQPFPQTTTQVCHYSQHLTFFYTSLVFPKTIIFTRFTLKNFLGILTNTVSNQNDIHWILLLGICYTHYLTACLQKSHEISNINTSRLQRKLSCSERSSSIHTITESKPYPDTDSSLL